MQSTILGTRQVRWPDETACTATASALAARPGLGQAFIELHGPLGAGKTTFVRHLLHALGVAGSVKSPTYALMEPYPAACGANAIDVAHFDFYRFDDPGEWEDAGFREVFARGGLKLVEWPDKAIGVLPPCDLRIEIVPDPDGEARDVRIDAMTPLGLELLP